MKDRALAAQVRAATPGASSWVAANAGSGKTRVLTDRVARLLLSGTDPARILCLTYTKAAAAEMQTRLFRTLGGWAMAEDATLRADLSALGEPAGAMPTAQLARARTLFARALETPGGLKIQTIHAFCEALLRRFPLEAGVAPQFEVLEDRQAKALREIVLDALAETRPGLAARTAAFVSGDDPDPLLAEIGRHRAAFEAPFDPAALAAKLRIDLEDSVEALLARTVLPEDLDDLRTLALLTGDAAIADALDETRPGARLQHLEGPLLYGAGTKAPWGAKIGKYPKREIRSAHPALCTRLEALMLRVEAARPQRLAFAAFERSSVLNEFARVWIERHDAAKRLRGVLDFDDLIDRARRLLADPATAAWVLWRLDGGIDHVLVDEAQDTSPAQWQVIQGISAEFFAGAGARDVARTIFVVGDEKQSIYSFQGADPAEFTRMRGHFERLLDGMAAELQRCGLIHSFRSAPPILALVDAVFAGQAGLDLDGPVTHAAIEPDLPGRVELWPFLPKPEKADDHPWHLPIPTESGPDPVDLLAARIAAEIRGWLDREQPLPGAGRPVRAGDVLILVQRRNDLFDAIIRELKRARVPVAGADLMRIGADLAVKDLLAALRVTATPTDDLSLAALLRSPLGGLGEDELFALAQGRSGSLWRKLRDAAPDVAPEIRAILADLLARADFERPYELLQRILIRHDGRRRLIARLGAEAEDGIDALLDQAIAYERVEPPGLTGFLAWIDRNELAVKRRTEEGSDQVRVMTVHGAKGLEAPIVILPDTATRYEGRPQPQILRLDDGQAVWRPRRDEAPVAILDAENRRREALRAENMRLLYVALTRPKSWLIVCGAGAEPKPDSHGWHALVSAAIDVLAPTVEQGPYGPRLVLEHRWTLQAPASAPVAREEPDPELPAGQPRRIVQPPRSPSGLGGGHVIFEPGAIAETDRAATVRGEAIHALIEILHDRPEADWPRLAAQRLGDGPDLPELLAEAAGVLRAPDLAFAFGPESFAEIDIAAPLAALAGATILGRVDRLVVEPGRVVALDFKSNRAVPPTPDRVPEGILRQMAAYRAALAAIWPERRVEAAIVWTRIPRFMLLPDPLLDGALLRAAKAIS